MLEDYGLFITVSMFHESFEKHWHSLEYDFGTNAFDCINSLGYYVRWSILQHVFQECSAILA